MASGALSALQLLPDVSSEEGDALLCGEAECDLMLAVLEQAVRIVLYGRLEQPQARAQARREYMWLYGLGAFDREYQTKHVFSVTRVCAILRVGLAGLRVRTLLRLKESKDRYDAILDNPTLREHARGYLRAYACQPEDPVCAPTAAPQRDTDGAAGGYTQRPGAGHSEPAADSAVQHDGSAPQGATDYAAPSQRRARIPRCKSIKRGTGVGG